MGKPLTREIAGLVWTYDPKAVEWRTPCGLIVWRCFKADFFGYDTDGHYPTMRAACEAEVAHREATRASPTVTPANDTAIEDGPVAQSASPTLDPGELDQMLNEEAPTEPTAETAARLDEVNAEREAQRRDERAYYRNVAGWAAVVVLALLCAGVAECSQPSDSNKSPNPAPGGDRSGVENER